MATETDDVEHQAPFESLPSKEEAQAATDCCQTLSVYSAFLMVGGACGWFVVNALWQTLANEQPLQRGGKMFGKVSFIGGSVGISSAFAYFAFLTWVPGGLSMRAAQVCSAILASTSVLCFVALALFWDYAAPVYPVFLAAGVIGNLVSNMTFYILFPLVSTYYGGWLIAPIRAGTDCSSLLTTLMAEAENPTGNRDLFPPWMLFAFYGLLSTMGLLAWLVIVRRGIGRRTETTGAWEDAETSCDSGSGASSEAEEDSAPRRPVKASVVAVAELSAGGLPQDDTMIYGRQNDDRSADGLEEVCNDGREVRTTSGALARFSAWLVKSTKGLACPRSLLLPVLLATLAQGAQWGVVNSFGGIGARMIDPEGCDGDRGKWVYRTALTMANVLIPVGSVASSIAPCPRRLFSLLWIVQFAAAVAVTLATLGAFRSWWFATGSQYLYIACIATVGSLEGYLLTMAYRYVGDAEGIPLELRQSASSLISFLGVLLVNPISMVLGSLVEQGSVACVPL